jgi:hypothetical protein
MVKNRKNNRGLVGQISKDKKGMKKKKRNRLRNTSSKTAIFFPSGKTSPTIINKMFKVQQ